jgi:hypothetical protein
MACPARSAALEALTTTTTTPHQPTPRRNTTGGAFRSHNIGADPRFSSCAKAGAAIVRQPLGAIWSLEELTVAHLASFVGLSSGAHARETLAGLLRKVVRTV